MAIAKNDNPEVSRTSSCYILSLPPEVLTKILSFILPSGFLQHCYGDMSLGFLKTLGEIRSICRTIRSVADNLPFWYDEDFEFEWLYPGYPGSYHRNRQAGLQYLEVMLADNHLRDCLSRRKRDWCVGSSTPATLEMLMRTIPGFKENAESVKEVVYATGKDGLDHVNLDELLEGYSSLRKLSFTSGTAHVYAKNLPAPLRELSIRHWHSCENCLCTLNAVRNLEYLCLDYSCSPGVLNVWTPDLASLLPTDSSTTLRSLTLNFYSRHQSINYSALDLFCNLKKLDITVSSSFLFKHLVTSTLRLEVIIVKIRHVNAFQELIPAIESRSFGSIREFGLGIIVRGNDDWDDSMTSYIEPTWERAVAAIVKLPYLEVICFNAPLQTGWSTYFIRRCPQLQFLCWNVDESAIPEDLDEVRSIFESALKHIRPEPCVAIIEQGGLESSETDDSWWTTSAARDWGL